jgi:hypothetical protein
MESLRYVTTLAVLRTEGGCTVNGVYGARLIIGEYL